MQPVTFRCGAYIGPSQFVSSFIVTGRWARRSSWPFSSLTIDTDHVTLKIPLMGEPLIVPFKNIEKVFIRRSGTLQFITNDEKTSFGVSVLPADKVIIALKQAGFDTGLDSSKISTAHARFARTLRILLLVYAIWFLIFFFYMFFKIVH